MLFRFSVLQTAFSSLIEGKDEEISTSELSGGARIHYIFQNIFVKSLEVCIIDVNVLDIDILDFSETDILAKMIEFFILLFHLLPFLVKVTFQYSMHCFY